ncbi:Calcium-transporting ATPase [Spironucleus salmonicida]|uniref:Calcium-transporting ATPase n=1 Tax=Spironucleus salmonicida TaxID=348837 RepID=V6LMK1_9EUKA|nr:Calcium-transporting ATPase [Spironucleus salmonicida]|eukprot:EST45438.1 Plasma membrane calcium-transporting ATPase [Spironucleus salmonicida]
MTETIPLFDAEIASDYKYTATELRDIVKNRNKSKFTETFQSQEQVGHSLHTTALAGISQNTVQRRIQLFGRNLVAPPPSKPFWWLLLQPLKDLTMMILLVSAIISIILTTTVADPAELEWIDGVAILFAVVIVTLVTACNDYSKEKQFRKLNAVKDDKKVKVIRQSQQCEISIHDVVVGDIILLITGDQIPADGLLLTGSEIRVDESGMTGESNEIKKTPTGDCFMIGSSLITSGSGRMVITGVGENSIYGDILLTLQEEDTQTPLQEKLDILAKLIGYIGMGSAGLTFLTLAIKFFTSHDSEFLTVPKNYIVFVDYLILAITIIVVAVPEGLPLAVTISLAYSMKQMIVDQCLVRKLEACETMGGVSNICSDKTGTLTLNQMRVVRAKFGKQELSKGDEDFGKTVQKTISQEALNAYCLASSINSTAVIQKETHAKMKSKETTEKLVVVGNKTEGALILLTQEMGVNYQNIRDALVKNEDAEGAVAYKVDFSSERKRMTYVIKNDDLASKSSLNFGQTNLTALTKGAPDMLFPLVKNYISENGSIQQFTDEVKQSYIETMKVYAHAALRTFVLAYRTLDSSFDFSLPQNVTEEEYKIQQDKLNNKIESDLTLICLVGIEDPLRDGVKDAVARCHGAGITVRMVTGDNRDTAVAISKNANILPSDYVDSEDSKFVIEGPKFRELTDAQVDQLLPTLVCMARSSPKDKYRLVTRLRSKREIVAATGDGSNDAPQLKAADVGLAMGIAGTEVAKEASDIIIMDDNFCSIVRAVEWGRTVMSNVRKFVQFQLSVNVVALVIAFLGAAVLDESPLSSIQLLYVNLIMDSLGSLALATEFPASNVLEADPVSRSASLLAPGMIRNVLLVSTYQIIVMLLFLFPTPGNAITFVPQSIIDGVEYGLPGYLELAQIYRYTAIYNFFIFVQIFNEFNSRRINNELNIFAGLKKSPMFLIVIVFTIVVQVMIMLVPGMRDIFGVFTCGKHAMKQCVQSDVTGISLATWAISLGCAACIFIIHFIGRKFIKLDLEFKVSEKKILKDLQNDEKRRIKAEIKEQEKEQKLKAKNQE